MIYVYYLSQSCHSGGSGTSGAVECGSVVVVLAEALKWTIQAEETQVKWTSQKQCQAAPSPRALRQEQGGTPRVSQMR